MTLYNHDFLVIRTPLLPFCLPIDIREVFRQSEAKEALLISSPLLFIELEKFLNNTLSDSKRMKLEATLFKFAMRMKSRCTPFGIFAGISIGEIADTTKYECGGDSQRKKILRPDMGYMDSIHHQLLKNVNFKNTIKFFSNNTIYNVGNEIRYTECKLSGTVRKYHLSKAESNDYLNDILTIAKTGATVSYLISRLKSKGIDSEEALEYVNDLIEARLLISEFELQVTNPNYYKIFFNRIKNFHPQIKKLLKDIDNIEKERIGSSIENIQSIIKTLREINPVYEGKDVIHVDLFKPCQKFSISKQILEELKKAIEFMSGVYQPAKVTSLEKFKEAFSKRYEEEVVPLSHVLDFDIGIGYPVTDRMNQGTTPLLEDLGFGSANNSGKDFVLGEWEMFLTNKLQSAIKEGLKEIRLEEEEVSRFYKHADPEIPTTLYTQFRVLGSSASKIDQGEFEILHKGTSGPSSTMLIGRFCYLDDYIESKVRKMLLDEEQFDLPNKVYAEIVHLPQGRAGNILTRPVLRNYEIPIYTPGSVDNDKIIALEDLWVSVRNGKIILWSKKLKKEVIPRMSNAHAYSPMNSIPQYVFLCDLQYDYDHSDIVWNWGHFNSIPFLPRIVFGKTILKEARWRIERTRLKISKKHSYTENLEKLKSYFKEHDIPNDFILKGIGDTQVLLHFDKEICQRITLEEILKRKEVILIENLHREDTVWMEEEDGKYINEFITTWKKKETNDITTHLSLNDQPTTQRRFNVGSEWLYCKIYTGTDTADFVLLEVIMPLVKIMLEKKIIDKWFFIRYTDPDFHLRIRFHGDKKSYSVILDELNRRLKDFLDQGRVWKLQLDTYIREIERYGELNIENSEDMFYHDSTTVTKLLSIIEDDENLRWQFALISLDELLNDFSCDIDEKIHLLSQLRNGYLEEFDQNNLEFKKQLGTKSRKLKKSITDIFEEINQNSIIVNSKSILRERSLNWQKNIEGILQNETKTNISKRSLIASYMHMTVNRFFKTKQRHQEMVLFDLLVQYYKSAKARKLGAM
jgi:lantibiotic biosynthesis protein